MRIVRFGVFGNIQYGVIEKDVVRGFQDSPFKDFKGPGSYFPLDGSTYNINRVKLLAPCNPSKYFGIELEICLADFVRGVCYEFQKNIRC
jgi:hypothetical protein